MWSISQKIKMGIFYVLQKTKGYSNLWIGNTLRLKVKEL